MSPFTKVEGVSVSLVLLVVARHTTFKTRVLERLRAVGGALV